METVLCLVFNRRLFSPSQASRTLKAGTGSCQSRWQSLLCSQSGPYFHETPRVIIKNSPTTQCFRSFLLRLWNSWVCLLHMSNYRSNIFFLILSFTVIFNYGTVAAAFLTMLCRACSFSCQRFHSKFQGFLNTFIFFCVWCVPPSLCGSVMSRPAIGFWIIHLSMHLPPLTWAWVVGAAAWAGKPQLPSPQPLHPALSGGSRGVPRPAKRHSPSSGAWGPPTGDTCLEHLTREAFRWHPN